MKFIRTVKVSVMAALFAGIGLSATADQQGTSVATNKPPLKVLSIGNSFSQSALVHTPVVAKAMGCELAYTHLFIAGCRLRQHAANMMSNHFPYVVQRTGRNNVYETPLDKCCKPRTGKKGARMSNIKPMLAAEKWDVVTIQQGSSECWKDDSYQPYADQLIKVIRELAPTAKIVVHQTWSYNNLNGMIHNHKTKGPGSWGFDQTGMYDRLTANYAKLARDYGLSVIPMGLAVQKFRKARNVTTWENDCVGSVRLKDGRPAGDSIHLGKIGKYLQGLVWVGALYGVDVSDCPYKPEWMDDETAALCRRCAKEALAENILEPAAAK